MNGSNSLGPHLSRAGQTGLLSSDRVEMSLENKLYNIQNELKLTCNEKAMAMVKPMVRK